MSGNGKLVNDFIASQIELINNSTPVMKPLKGIIDRKSKMGDIGEEEDPLAFIIRKKPKAKKVSAFLQSLIDSIAAENDL